MDAPGWALHASPGCGVPFSHVQLFFRHSVLSELSLYPDPHALHMEAPLLVHSEPDFGVPFSHLQLFCCARRLADLILKDELSSHCLF